MFLNKTYTLIIVFSVLLLALKGPVILRTERLDDDKTESPSEEDKVATSDSEKDKTYTEVPDSDFDSLDDLKAKMTSTQYIKYMTNYYPLIYSEYVKTKKVNRMLSFVLISLVVGFFFILFIVIYYYRNKYVSKKRRRGSENMTMVSE